MAFDPDRLLNWDFEEIRQNYDARDAILYALGVGLPFAEGESDDLAFLIEDRLRVLPAFAVTLATLGGAYIVIAPLAFAMGVALNALEFLVAGLQAYVFAILTCVYLNDALHPAH